MKIEDVFRKIENSALLRADFVGLVEPLVRGIGAEKGYQLAKGIFRTVMQGFTDGKEWQKIVAEGNSELLLLGLKGDIADTVHDIEESCKKEISAIVLSRSMYEMGIDVEEVFRSVRADLFQEKPFPQDEAVQIRIRKELMYPIVISAKQQVIEYLEKAIAEIGESDGVKRIDGYLEMFLALSSSADEVPEEGIVEILLSRTKNDSRPAWIADFVAACVDRIQREVVAMRMVNYGWAKGLSIDDIAKKVRICLES